MLREVREATRQRRERRNQGYQLSGEEGFYRRILDCLVRPGLGRLLVARHSGEAVAALFFSTFNRRAYSVFSGSTETGYRLGAQSALFWNAVTMFKGEGFVELNRGGVPASAADPADPLHGIYRFKARLGTSVLRCRSGSKVLSPGRMRLLAFRQRLSARGRTGRHATGRRATAAPAGPEKE